MAKFEYVALDAKGRGTVMVRFGQSSGRIAVTKKKAGLRSAKGQSSPLKLPLLARMPTR